MVTPRDIAMVEFRKVWRGYEPRAVDDFLTRVASAYEAVMREREELKKQLEAARSEAEQLRRRPDLGRPGVEVGEILRFAREAADEAREKARDEARLILEEARLKAVQVENATRAELAAQLQRVERLKEEEAQILKRLRVLRGLIDEALLLESGTGPAAGTPEAGQEQAEPEQEEKVASTVEAGARLAAGRPGFGAAGA